MNLKYSIPWYIAVTPLIILAFFVPFHGVLGDYLLQEVQEIITLDSELLTLSQRFGTFTYHVRSIPRADVQRIERTLLVSENASSPRIAIQTSGQTYLIAPGLDASEAEQIVTILQRHIASPTI